MSMSLVINKDDESTSLEDRIGHLKGLVDSAVREISYLNDEFEKLREVLGLSRIDFARLRSQDFVGVNSREHQIAWQLETDTLRKANRKLEIEIATREADIVQLKDRLGVTTSEFSELAEGKAELEVSRSVSGDIDDMTKQLEEILGEEE
jgi:predicted  nucleic acid-binding Zn-ribbon protein